MIYTCRLEPAHHEQVEVFAQACSARGYTNNNSLDSMKYNWCLDNGGAWFATFNQDKIISLSGVHPFQDGYRALFRGVQTQPRPAGLDRNHMQSYCFHSQLPYQIAYAGGQPVYVTTNIENDASGKMNRIDRLFAHLERNGIVQLAGCEEVFYTLQNIWQIDIAEYLCARFNKKF